MGASSTKGQVRPEDAQLHTSAAEDPEARQRLEANTKALWQHVLEAAVERGREERLANHSAANEAGREERVASPVTPAAESSSSPSRPLRCRQCNFENDATNRACVACDRPLSYVVRGGLPPSSLSPPRLVQVASPASPKIPGLELPSSVLLKLSSRLDTSLSFNVHGIPGSNGCKIFWRAEWLQGDGLAASTMASGWQHLQLGSGVSQATITGLEPGTLYTIQVHTSAGHVASARVRTGPAVPGPPSPLTAAEITASSMLLSWSEPSMLNGIPADSYLVETKEAEGGSFKRCYEGKQRLFVARNLQSKKVYVFRCAAINALGRGAWSRSSAFRTTGDHTRLETPWIELFDKTQRRSFYYHEPTKRSSWVLPEGAIVDREDSFRRRRTELLEVLREQSRAPDAVRAAYFTRVCVKRDDLLNSSYRAFSRLRREELLRPLRVNFDNEAGIDAGGLVKDFFLELSQCFADGNLGLLAGSEDKDVFIIDPRSSHVHLPDDLIGVCRFLGRFLAKALLDRHIVDLRFHRTVFLFLLGQPATMADLESLDRHRHTGLKWMLENSIEGVLCETFSVALDVMGAVNEVELQPGGLARDVTDANKEEFVGLAVQFAAVECVRPQLSALAAGFHELVPLEALRGCGVQANDLATMLLGREAVDVGEVEAVARYHGGFGPNSPQVVWFWACMRGFSGREQQAVLRFVTGLHKVPLDGFEPPFTIVKSTHEGGAASFPRSHTCFNSIALPEYSSQEELLEKLRFAISNAPSAFLMS